MKKRFRERLETLSLDAGWAIVTTYCLTMIRDVATKKFGAISPMQVMTTDARSLHGNGGRAVRNLSCVQPAVAVAWGFSVSTGQRAQAQPRMDAFGNDASVAACVTLCQSTPVRTPSIGFFT